MKNRATEEKTEMFDISENATIIGNDFSLSGQEIKRLCSIFERCISNTIMETKIVLCLKRDKFLLPLVLALLRIKKTYIPVLHNYSNEYLNDLLGRFHDAVIITNKEYADTFINAGVKLYYIEDLLQQDVKNEIIMNKNELAYIMFTSGSTGKPKGVMVAYESLYAFCRGFENRLCEYKIEKILFHTAITFDVWFIESIFALLSGYQIYLLDDNQRNNPREICRVISKHHIDTVQFTPSTMKMLINYDDSLKNFDSVRLFMLGGEKMTDNLLRHIERNSKGNVLNLYGPTEATIYVTSSELDSGKEISIGTPFENVEISIVTQDGTLAEFDESGEIMIEGSYVAEGYYGASDLTKDRFSIIDGKKRYATGDIGKISKNGEILYCGRNDHQIKLRGQRIELEEIENAASSYSGLNNVMAAPIQLNQYNTLLVLFFTAQSEIQHEDLREYLTQKLKQIEIPARIQQLQSFCMNERGKIDRKATVSEYLSECCQQNKNEIGMDDVTKEISEIITDILVEDRILRIPLDAKLEEYGLDSISFIKIVVELENKFQIEFEDEDLDYRRFVSINHLKEYVSENSERCAE